jgi:hypothetical protein
MEYPGGARRRKAPTGGGGHCRAHAASAIQKGMSLTFSGPGGTVECRWIAYALLRDNVLHYLEGGTPSGRFAALHGISLALGSSSVKVLASELGRELSRARSLCDRPIDDLALSARTFAVIAHTWPPPAARETKLASEFGTIPGFASGAKTLGDVFGGLIDELITVSSGGDASAAVEVIDS